MQWQECSNTDERKRFMSQHLDGEKIAMLCRELEMSGAFVCKWKIEPSRIGRNLRHRKAATSNQTIAN